jgi:cell division protein DivIC
MIVGSYRKFIFLCDEKARDFSIIIKMNIKRIWFKALPFVKNKYILTSFIFLIWMFFFDNNNLIDRYHALRALNQLQKDKKYYIQKIETDTRKLNELRTNKENLEKFAREQYLMKKKNEDIFIIVKE